MEILHIDPLQPDRRSLDAAAAAGAALVEPMVAADDAGAARNCAGTLSGWPHDEHGNDAADWVPSMRCLCPQAGHCSAVAISVPPSLGPRYSR